MRFISLFGYFACLGMGFFSVHIRRVDYTYIDKYYGIKTMFLCVR